MTSPITSFCGQCGATLTPETRFCAGCGTRVSASGFTGYTQVKQLFERALAVEPSKRDAWLVKECNGDAKLLAELRAMFAAQAADFLKTAAADAPEPPVSQTQMIGPYRILREVGRGGMGVVHLAVRDDGAFRKNVAVKLLLREHVSPEFVSRFKQERQVLAALDHPNIARILDGGNTPEGSPYYVMEFIEGLPLDKYCDQQRLSLTGRVKLFQQVCQAVEYLHSNSIMHRDLKPSNVLVSADGVVKLLDFGIAKVVGAGSWSNPDLTNVSAQPMTPTYASPEQIGGVTLQKTSDLYSLGAILYVLLTGRPAYQDLDEKVAKLEARILPSKPSSNIREDLRSKETTAQFRRAMMGELDSIVLMAMQIDPKERYQSAAAMVEDLQHFLDGSPVTAHHGGVAKRSVKLLQRKSAAIAILAGFLVLASVAVWQWQRIEHSRAEALVHEAYLKQTLERLEARVDHLAGQNEAQIEDIRLLKTAFHREFPDGNKSAIPMGANGTLLARGVKYLDRVRAGTSADASLNVEVGDAYQQLGSIQEKVARTGDKREALKTYQKSATVLVKADGSEPARLRLSKVNLLIKSLGGTPVLPEQPKTEVVETPKPDLTPLVQVRPMVPVVHNVPEPPTPKVVEASEPVRMPAEVRDALLNAESKALIAEQNIAPLKQSLERDGQTLNADTVSRLMQMRSSLERARRNFADGEVDAARESIRVTDALANKLLQSVGR